MDSKFNYRFSIKFNIKLQIQLQIQETMKSRFNNRFNSRLEYVLDFRFKIKFNIKSYSRFSIIVMQASKKTIRKFQIGFHMKFLIQYHMQVTISLGSMYTTTDRLIKHNVVNQNLRLDSRFIIVSHFSHR